MDNLEHYGVKGMKWGQRRAKKRAMKKALKAAREANKRRSRKTASKWSQQYSHRSSMSDHDLQRAVNRLRLENEFGAQLSKSKQYLPKSRGQEAFDRALKVVNSVSGAVKGTNNFTKDIAGIGNNTVATYRNSRKILDVDKLETRTGRIRR